MDGEREIEVEPERGEDSCITQSGVGERVAGMSGSHANLKVWQ